MKPLNRILLGTDFSPGAAAAVRCAGELGRSFGSEILLVHVDEAAGPSPGQGSDPDHRVAGLARSLGEACAALREAGLRCRRVLSSGDAAVEILRLAVAERCGLIVVGSHGRSDVRGLLLGSVADRVVRRAPLPVLVARHPETVCEDDQPSWPTLGATAMGRIPIPT